jgi:hypothetical protein
VHRIVNEEPPRPSARLASSPDLAAVAQARKADPARLIGAVRGELDWIVWKALEKQRGRRFESASALGRDVQRCLDDEPVEACPPSRRYRLAKFWRKHRVALSVAAAFVSLILLGLVGLVVAMVQVDAARRQAETALAAETQAREQTGGALNLTDAVLDSILRNRARLNQKQKMVLRNLLPGYQVFLAEPTLTPATRVIAARTQLRVAQIQVLTDQPAEAVASYRRAIRRYQDLANDFSDVLGHRTDLARRPDPPMRPFAIGPRAPMARPPPAPRKPTLTFTSSTCRVPCSSSTKPRPRGISTTPRKSSDSSGSRTSPR